MRKLIKPQKNELRNFTCYTDESQNKNTVIIATAGVYATVMASSTSGQH